MGSAGGWPMRRPASTPAPASGPPDEELIDRVQRLTGELEGIADSGARAIAEQLMAALLELYGEGLERILALIGDDSAGRSPTTVWSPASC